MSALPPELSFSPVVRPGPQLDALLRGSRAPDRQLHVFSEAILRGSLVELLTAAEGPGRLTLLGGIISYSRGLGDGAMSTVVDGMWWPMMREAADSRLAPWLSIELWQGFRRFSGARAQAFFVGYLALFGVDDALTWLLTNCDGPKAEAPVSVLAASGEAAALSLLTRLVLTAQTYKSRLAARALAGLDEVGLPWLLYVLERGEVTARASAAMALARPPAAALPALAAALRGERSAVVRAALGVALFNGRDRAPFEDRGATAEAHAALDAELAGQPAMRLPRWLLLKEQTPLRWSSGACLSEGATRWILTRLATETATARDPDLGAVLAHTRPDNHPLFLKLLERQRAARGPIKAPGWLLWARIRLGDAAILEETGREMWSAVYLGQYGVADDARDVLALTPGVTHLHWFDRLLNQRRWMRFCGGAWDALARRAGGSALEADAQLEAALPTLGFDDEGRKPVRYGQRTLSLVMGEQGAIELWGEGRLFRSLPRARNIDDPVVIKAAQKAVREDRARIGDYHAAQLLRFERAIGTGRSWPASRWRALLTHPLTRRTLRGLLWERVGLAGPRRFCVDDHGDLWDRDYEPVVLPRSGRVRLAHPAELTRSERARWWEIFGESERVPVLDQFSRPALTEADDPRASRPGLPKLRDYFIDTFIDTLRSRGYRPEGPPDAPETCARPFADGWSVRLAFTPFDPAFSSYDQADDIELTGFWYLRAGREVSADSVPARVLSEGLRDLTDVLR